MFYSSLYKIEVSHIMFSTYIINKMGEVEAYNVYPQDKDCIYTTEHWTNTLSNGKVVTVLHVQQWRSGTFSIEVDEVEKEKLMAQESIVLNDCGASVEELSEGWFYECKVKNEELYDNKDLKEIHRRMFRDDDNDHEYDSGEEYDFDQDLMEANDWSLDDTVYEITGGCEMELTS